jgi:hypothetical protein
MLYGREWLRVHVTLCDSRTSNFGGELSVAWQTFCDIQKNLIISFLMHIEAYLHNKKRIRFGFSIFRVNQLEILEKLQCGEMTFFT